jgi:ABC-2 type transport system ATP-binding protein
MTVTTAQAALAVDIRGVAKAYGPVPAVRDVSLEIPRGGTVALLGPNGAGKSTTIAMMTGLIDPDAGEVRVCGLDPRTAVRSGRIAVMLQDAGLMPGVTVAELVGLGHHLYPSPLPVGQALALAGLSEVARRRVDRLSGGQTQRLRFALVAVANPDVLVLDEPTRALDVAGRREFWTAMRGYAAAGRTVLFATHYLDEVEENADRVVVMVAGRVVADGTPDEVRRHAGSSVVRLRLAGPGPDLAEWQRLPGVSTVDINRDVVVLHTQDADATVRALAASTLGWRDLAVSPPSLDDSFLALTDPALTNPALTDPALTNPALTDPALTEMTS